MDACPGFRIRHRTAVEFPGDTIYSFKGFPKYRGISMADIQGKIKLVGDSPMNIRVQVYFTRGVYQVMRQCIAAWIHWIASAAASSASFLKDIVA